MKSAAPKTIRFRIHGFQIHAAIGQYKAAVLLDDQIVWEFETDPKEKKGDAQLQAIEWAKQNDATRVRAKRAAKKSPDKDNK